MFVSPLVPVSPALPPLDTILKQALGAEVLQTGLTVESESPLEDVTATDGLEGRRLRVTVRHPGADMIQRRVYTMYRDESWLYGIHFIAEDAVFDFFLPEYEATANSIQAVAPPTS